MPRRGAGRSTPAGRASRGSPGSALPAPPPPSTRTRSGTGGANERADRLSELLAPRPHGRLGPRRGYASGPPDPAPPRPARARSQNAPDDSGDPARPPRGHADDDTRPGGAQRRLSRGAHRRPGGSLGEGGARGKSAHRSDPRGGGPVVRPAARRASRAGRSARRRSDAQAGGV